MKVDTSQVLKNLSSYNEDMMGKMAIKMDRLSGEGENFAKKSATWTDRTSNARNSINGYSENEKDIMRMYLSIGMFYGVYLELSNGGKYRIIWPAIEWLSSQFERFMK